MEQLIAICILVFWVGCGVYLYRVDPGNERYWCGNKTSFFIEVLFKSTCITFFASAIFAVVGTLILVAIGAFK